MNIIKDKTSNVDRVYEAVKAMSANFELKPNERINESQLSKKLGASRTPLREALNRLVAEGMLTFEQGRGFFCRPLAPKEIIDLYEARLVIERETVSRTCQRADDDQLESLVDFLETSRKKFEIFSEIERVRIDEAFHMMIAKLSDNSVLVHILENINVRIRFIRWINLQEHRRAEHFEIAEAIRDRNIPLALKTIDSHIEMRAEEITEAVRVGYARIYVPDEAQG